MFAWDYWQPEEHKEFLTKIVTTHCIFYPSHPHPTPQCSFTKTYILVKKSTGLTEDNPWNVTIKLD